MPVRRPDLKDLRFRLDTKTRPLLPDTIGVTLSACGQYRYRLWRVWDHALPYVLFIGLNPSAGDDTTDDPAVLACQRMAVAAGYGGFHLMSLFAWRRIDQMGLLSVADPIGKDNDAILLDAALQARLVVCTWGSDDRIGDRDAAVLKLLRQADIAAPVLTANADGSLPDLFCPTQSIENAIPL